jgi:hypothetical protein
VVWIERNGIFECGEIEFVNCIVRIREHGEGR